MGSGLDRRSLSIDWLIGAPSEGKASAYKKEEFYKIKRGSGKMAAVFGGCDRNFSRGFGQTPL